MIKRNLVIIVLIGIFAQQAWCQEEGPDEVGLPNANPISPTAATMSKHENYAVDLSTGVPNISFPLINVSSGDLSVQLSLSYHAGGHRVNEKDGWAGLGWSILGAGKISRSMRGLPDDSPNGFMKNTSHINIQSPSELLDETPTAVPVGSTVGYELRRALATSGFDSHSDVYNYSYPGGGGTFYYNNSGKAFTVPYTANNIRLKYESNGTDSYYEITAPNQTIYQYKEVSFTRLTGVSGSTGAYTDPYVADYFLTKIISSDGSDSILFEYKSDIEYTESYTSFRKTIKYDQSLPPVALDHNSIQASNKYDNKRLSRIIFQGGRVEFTSANRVNNIILMDENNAVIKTIDFDYQSYVSEPNCVIDCARNKLTALHINDQNYEFYYENMAVPSRQSLDQDHWGFYNGANNTSLLPNIEWQGTTHGDGAERHTNSDFAKFGMLNKVVYPTGGSTQYEFESNDVFSMDQLDYDDSRSTIFNLQGISSVDGSSDREDFTFPQPFVFIDEPFEVRYNSIVTIKVTFAIMPKNGNYNDGPELPTKTPSVIIPGDYNSNSDIKYDPQGDHVYDERYDLFFQTVNKEIYISDWEEHANTFTLISSTNERSYVKAELMYSFLGAEDQSYSNWKVGGMRVASITSKGSNNEFIGKRSYSYLDSADRSTAKLTKGDLSLFKNLHVYYDYYLISQDAMSSEGMDPYLGRFILHDTPRQGIASGNPVTYSQVTEQILDARNVIIGATEYHYGGAQDFMPLTYPANFGTSAPWNKGKIVKTVVKKVDSNGNRTPVKITKTEYATISGPNELVSYGVNVVQDRSFTWRQIMGIGGISSTPAYLFLDPTRFVWDYYYQTTAVKVPARTTVEEIGSDGSVLEMQEVIYEYVDDEGFDDDDYFHLLRSRKQKTSSSSYNKSVNTYSFDHFSNLENPIGSKILLIEKAQYKESEETSELIGLSRYTYTYDNKIEGVYTKPIASPIANFAPLYDRSTLTSLDDYVEEKHIEYLSGDKRRVSHVQEKGVGSSYLWNHDSTNVIATTLNAEPEEVAFTSFENATCPDEGNWNFISSVINTLEDSFTGRYSYNHNENTISSNQIPNGQYLVSFWAKKRGNNNSYVKVQNNTIDVAQDKWQYYELEIAGGQVINVLPNNVYLDDLRLHPVDAQMTTYTHKSLVGVSSVSDPSNRKQSYEYDDVGRLKYIKDQDGNIITINEYNYINSAN